MLLAFVLFWVILVLGRNELGLKGWMICAPLGLGFLAAFLFWQSIGIYAVVAQVLLDIVLILYVFKGDIRIN